MHVAVQGVSTVFVLIVGFGYADGESLLYIGIVIFNEKSSNVKVPHLATCGSAEGR